MARTYEIARGVHWLRLPGANVYFVRSVESWTLVDAGFPGSAAAIRRTAAAVCGGKRPAAIVLTHGHPDHAGASVELAEAWDRPVHVPAGELPFVDGSALYPEPLVGFLRRVLPGRTIDALVRNSDLGPSVRSFEPRDGIPGLPDWQGIPTPGHTPGHLALFRPADRTLLTGDAVITLAWWSRLDDRGLRWIWDLVRCTPRLTGPPTIVTCDWRAAADSIVALSELDPWAVATGHGIPLAGRHVAPLLRSFAARVRAVPVD